MGSAARDEGLDDCNERLRFLGIDDDTRAALREFHPVLVAALPGIMDAFYAHIRQWPELNRLFAGDAAVGRARDAQVKHWERLFSGRFDAEYVRSVRRIGATHSRVGLEPRWYIGAYTFTVSRLLELAVRSHGSRLRPAEAQARTARLARALNQAAMLDMELAVSVYLEENRATHDRRLAELAGGFETTIRTAVEDVAAVAQELQSNAQAMASAAEMSRSRAASAASAAGQASGNVDSVAVAANQLSASIGEITRQVSESSRIADEAVEQAQATDTTMRQLAESAQKIGEVVALINQIAGQTNLLALNATIEAARAGEYGKGFAVVASEVKSLASQTGKATEDIRAQIAAVQSVTEQAVEAIGAIDRTIRRMSEISTTIASAVEQQGAATTEIARNVQQATTGSTEVSSNIRDVAAAAGQTGESAGHVLSAARRLGEQASGLRSQVDSFLGRLRTS